MEDHFNYDSLSTKIVTRQHDMVLSKCLPRGHMH